MLNDSHTQSTNATCAPNETEPNINPDLLPILNYVAEIIHAGNDMDPSPDQAALMQKILGLLEGNKRLSHAPGSVIMRCKAVLSPIRRVPTEIWSMIFLMCLNADEDDGNGFRDEDFVEARENEAPLNIAGVCQRWRAIALSTPSLWRSLEITRTVDLHSSHPHPELAFLWLARSAPHPISFSFGTEEDNVSTLRKLEDFHEPKRNFPLLQILVVDMLMCMPRWRRVRLDLPFLDGYDFPIPETGAPFLESLKVTRRTVQSWTRIDQFIHRIWVNAPHLRRFDMNDETECSRGDKTLLPLPSGLTELRLEYDLSLTERWGILRASPDLITCSLERVSGVDDSAMNFTPVFLPKLQSLTLGSMIYDFVELQVESYLTNVLNFITAPNLQKFAMKWDHGYLHEPFISFVARSAFALTELCIINIPISQTELEEVLILMSGSIKVLQMEECVGFGKPSLGKQLLQLLTWRGRDEAFLCPNLESISVDSSIIGKRYGLLTIMVESRWHIGDGRTQLTKVTITIPKNSKKHKASLDQLKRLRNEGLSVVIAFGIERRNVEDTDNEDTDDEDTDDEDMDDEGMDDEGTDDEDTGDEDTDNEDTKSGYTENEETEYGEDTEELL